MNYRYGFTLIELLIVVVVMGLLLTGSLAAYSTFNTKQTLISSGQTLKNILRDAQSRSFTGQKDCTQCGCSGSPSDKSLIGWKATFIAPRNVQLTGTCGSTDFATPTYIISNSSDISFSNSPSPIQFLPLARGVSPSSTTTICLQSTKTANLYKLTVDPGGNITDYGLQSSCP